MHTTNRINTRLHAAELLLLTAVGVFLLSGALSLQTQSALADKVVRLHVLANSDSCPPAVEEWKLQLVSELVKK